MRDLIFEKELSDFADNVERLAVEVIDEKNIIGASNKLRSGVHVRLEGQESTNPRIICYAEGESAAYAKYVHDGRPKGIMPPVSPLMEWARKKLDKEGRAAFPEIGGGMVNRTRISLNKSGTRVRGNKKDMASFDAARNIAWAVAKGIERDGIEAKEYFLEAFERAVAEWGDEG